MPKKIITEEHIKEIKRLGQTMTAKQVSKELRLNYHTVYEHMKKFGVQRKIGKTRRWRGEKGEKERLGYFNVSARENWLV